MMMAIKDGQILIKDVNSTQYTVIKSWGMMKWVRSEQMLKGPVTKDLLNHLAELVKLPESVEKERQYLNALTKAIDRERMDPDPKVVVKPPVKVNLFQHQVRGYNMALIALGLVDPSKVERG